MIRRILVTTLAILIGSVSVATADELRPIEKLATLAAYAYVDYDQSTGVVTPGGSSVEGNPLLGDHPSREDMLMFGAAGIGLAYIATEILPEPWDRIVLDSVLASEQFNIEENALVLDGKKRKINGIPFILRFEF